MDAWSGAPVPIQYVRGRSPLQLQGALVFQNKQCRNCHSLGGEGGRRGPALDDIASRMTRDLLIRQVLQGGGNMPAYGKNLSPAEVTALVGFLDTLRSPRDAAARSPVPPPRADR
jgi:ubiquinol-cytochrome c reductase cytochrome b subunit